MKGRLALTALLLAVLALLSACKANPSEEELYARLFAHFQSAGYTCELAAVDEGRDVPIYNASVWRSLVLNGAEEVLVYFDESNRADYLASRIDTASYGYITRFGLRFVLMYQGSDEGVASALLAIRND